MSLGLRPVAIGVSLFSSPELESTSLDGTKIQSSGITTLFNFIPVFLGKQ